MPYFQGSREHRPPLEGGLFILSPWSCRRGGDWGRLGYPGVKSIFFKHGHVTYQIDRDDKQIRMQVKFSS